MMKNKQILMIFSICIEPAKLLVLADFVSSNRGKWSKMSSKIAKQSVIR